MDPRTEAKLARQSLQNFGSTGDMNAVFEIYKDLGLIPPKYKNWVDLTLAYQAKIDSGLSIPKANKELGIATQKNIFKNRTDLSNDILNAWIANDDQFVNKFGNPNYGLIQKLRDKFTVVKNEEAKAEQLAKEKEKQAKARGENPIKRQKATAYEMLREAGNRAGVRLDLDAPYFMDVRVIGPNRRTIRFEPHEAAIELIKQKHGEDAVKSFNKYLKEGWEGVGREETQLMKQLTGRAHDRGHFFSAYYAGPPDIENASAELAALNRRTLPGDVRLPQEPRFDAETMRRMGIPENTLQSYYEWELRSMGLLRGSGLQERISPYLTNLVDAGEMTLERAVGIQDQLEQRSGGKMSEGYEEALRELSPVLSQQQTTGGPVTVLQEGKSRINVYNTETGKKVRSQPRINNGAIRYLPLAGLGIGLVTAQEQARAGEYSEAAFTALETGVGELPFGDFVVDVAAGSPVAEGTLSERAQQVYEEDKSKLPINVPVTNPTDPFAQAPSYVKPDYSRVGTQKP